jgi:hypothetical protein
MRFDKEKFVYECGYIWYQLDSGERKFVARFKYRFQRGGKGAFLKFLIANFSVEEYFAALDSGLAPLQVLDSKGFDSLGRAKARRGVA